jgi:PAS domain S-box-containing protein
MCHISPQALEGFVLLTTSTGKIMYVSETASVHVGMSQFELIGSDVQEFVHPDDTKVFEHVLHAADADVQRVLAAPIGGTLSVHARIQRAL